MHALIVEYKQNVDIQMKNLGPKCTHVSRTKAQRRVHQNAPFGGQKRIFFSAGGYCVASGDANSGMNKPNIARRSLAYGYLLQKYSILPQVDKTRIY